MPGPPVGTAHPQRPGPPHRLLVGLATALLVATASACTADSSTQSADPGDQPPAGAANDQPAGSASQPAVDACTLLTADEVTPIIGTHDGGGPGAGVGESVCVWENPDTYHSVTVSIGGAGTAASGELPAESAYGETEPGPDGIRFAPGGIAEFIVGDRASEVQVVAPNADRAVTVELIALVRSRL
ncbi:DUF3558 family protein [Micromonospora sp. NBC_01813]|uniref:DUF3558 family protein n=1 Tax=Micromonospora sp. NBC_01813 TaxID=2975988 RepID=UPI002DDC7999|nr:hypothetical protein [Micromonospora sp. NBC_01813]WSA07277.1 DUF3558 domain-containing protein [Micromonospora sp. NBC_01813]